MSNKRVALNLAKLLPGIANAAQLVKEAEVIRQFLLSGVEAVHKLALRDKEIRERVFGEVDGLCEIYGEPKGFIHEGGSTNDYYRGYLVGIKRIREAVAALKDGKKPVPH